MSFQERYVPNGFNTKQDFEHARQTVIEHLQSLTFDDDPHFLYIAGKGHDEERLQVQHACLPWIAETMIPVLTANSEPTNN